MDLDNLNLEMAAAVHWRNPSPHRPELGARCRRFASFANAIRFVMEDLTDFPQSTARISAGAVDLTFSQVSLLYTKLKPNQISVFRPQNKIAQRLIYEQSSLAQTELYQDASALDSF